MDVAPTNNTGFYWFAFAQQKLWGRIYINADNNYTWTFPITYQKTPYIALSTDAQVNADAAFAIGLGRFTVNSIEFAKANYQQVFAMAIGV